MTSLPRLALQLVFSSLPSGLKDAGRSMISKLAQGQHCTLASFLPGFSLLVIRCHRNSAFASFPQTLKAMVISNILHSVTAGVLKSALPSLKNSLRIRESTGRESESMKTLCLPTSGTRSSSPARSAATIYGSIHFASYRLPAAKTSSPKEIGRPSLRRCAMSMSMPTAPYRLRARLTQTGAASTTEILLHCFNAT